MAVDCDLDGVELLGDWRGSDPRHIIEVLDDHGLEVFSLTPGDADISHPDPDVRAKAMDYYSGLVDFAAELGNPIVSIHGLVKRIAPVSSQSEEDALLAVSSAEICRLAQARGLQVVFEILNRYETHHIRNVSQGLAFLDRVGAANLKLLPDAYHMNIEEADPAGALRAGRNAIGLYHAADSNRGGVGDGHVDFDAQIQALDDIGYQGPIILEVAAPGPNPFQTDKGEGFRDVLVGQLKASVKALRALGT